MQDIVVSAVSQFGYDKLAPWVNSLNRCGFTGKKIMIAFNILDDIVKQLQDNDIHVIVASKNRNKDNNGYHYQDNFTDQVPTARHYYNWLIFKSFTDVRYIISTDCSDVVFQRNPSEWLENNLGDKKLNYGGEGLRYKDEPWGNENMMECFGPVIHSYMKDTPIYNAGSMAGEHKTFVDFSLAVFLACQHINNRVPDQASVNLMLSLEPYKSITKFNDHDSDWACQCGTTVDPNKMNHHRPNLLCNEPTFNNGHAYNSKNEEYVLLHQYNRVPSWKQIVEAKYGS